jgi:hypothetical protein
LRKRTINFVMSVCPSVSPHSVPTGRTFMKLDIRLFFGTVSRKSKLHSKRTRKTGTLREDLHTFLIISRSLLLRMRNVSDKTCGETRNTHLVFNNFPPSPENRADYELMRENTVERDRPQITIWRVRIACWITKATNGNTQVV